jgi:aarF domain-containing kinase
MLTESNVKRLVAKLTKMRGAALKLGQFMSIQGPYWGSSMFDGNSSAVDTHLLPPEAEAIFRRVQDSAHYMPDWQMEVRIR